ncbi:hypothetical protein ACFFK0_20345 [Paenibacillus chartarius]|uniref:Uncharacterized protein n=1 Tax=Paenibacillus chartarius TaxID=747481 RepID=A0ABV6DQ44_9BACL
MADIQKHGEQGADARRSERSHGELGSEALMSEVPASAADDRLFFTNSCRSYFMFRLAEETE